MHIYIWQDVANATKSYHSSGGVVIVAKDLDRARELLAEPYCTSMFHGDGDHECSEEGMKSRADCGAMTEAPDYFYPLHGDHSESVVIFENSGCC